MTKSTMGSFSYGLEKPGDLLKKLVRDGGNLTASPHPYDVFNSVVTAAVLNEWIKKCYGLHPLVAAVIDAQRSRDANLFPLEAVEWIADRSCITGMHSDPRFHIMNAMAICWDTANASKHYHWNRSSDVSAIESTPVIKSWSQYFFTSVSPDLYIEYGGGYYGLSQLRGILVQFYAGLLRQIEGADQSATQNESSQLGERTV